MARETLSLARGHEAVLLTLVDQVVAQSGAAFSELDRIAVTIGPGSFTGLRIGVAAARAFGLVTKAPVVGVSTLAAFAAAELQLHKPGAIIAAVDARKGRVYAQAFSADGRAEGPARLIEARQLLRSLPPGPLRLVGSGAPILAIEAWRSGRSAEVGENLANVDIAAVARLGALADPQTAQPRPLYFEAAAVTLPQQAAPSQDGPAPKAS
jgi:tRNA threonylcarbamoyl adenosine modification protein YeaZ